MTEVMTERSEEGYGLKSKIYNLNVADAQNKNGYSCSYTVLCCLVAV